MPAAVETDPDLPLLGETFAVEYSNSRYLSGTEDLDLLATADSAARWFRAAPDARDITLPDPVAPLVLAELRRARDATRAVLTEVAGGGGGPTPAWRDAATALGELSASASARVVLERDGERGRWCLQIDGTADRVAVATVASRCAMFLGGDQLRRVRRCARPACPMLFVQHHAARRYCSDSCSHSDRQRRYYRRTRAVR